MALKDEDHIDFDKLEQELNSAVEADQKYWRENDAKFRAVEQRVATYDEFREIVQAAHLRPLEKEDKIQEDARFTQPWNINASKNREKVKVDNKHIPQAAGKLPKNGHEFTLDWRRYCNTNEDKLNFLVGLGGEKISDIFKAEISMGLLGEIILALCEFKDEQTAIVTDILESLSKANRFQLSLDFLSKKESEACQTVLQKLMNKAGECEKVTSERLENLKKLYCK